MSLVPFFRMLHDLDNFYYHWPTTTLPSSNTSAFSTLSAFEKLDDNTFMLEAPVPGFTKDDLNVEVLEERYLSVWGNAKYTRGASEVERKFAQQWSLPRNADPSSVQAKVANGILTVHVKTQGPPRRQVHRIALE